MASWTYILLCADGSYYTGCTTNWEQRWGQHQAGALGRYTADRRPLKVAWLAEFQHLDDAIAMERRLKRWSRAKKEAAIRGEWDRLPTLARNRQYHPKPG
jgi:predicted GIY-YIG superfamily endonuclease